MLPSLRRQPIRLMARRIKYRLLARKNKRPLFSAPLSTGEFLTFELDSSEHPC